MTAAPALSHGLVEATEPPEYRGIPRDAVRMLVTNRATRAQSHANFYDLPSLLRRGDLLVVNDSATLPAALVCRPPLHISTKIDERLWMVEPRGPVVSGEKLTLPGGGTATMLAPVDPRRPRVWYATFEIGEAMYPYLAKHGAPITYAYVTRTFPLQTYQTIFARTEGSSEMPSAARPFTERIVARLSDNGIAIATITLHCGVASFERPERPGTERFIVPAETAARVNAARREGHRVVAVGTTVVRALESAASEDGIVASQGWTDLFIDETYQLKSIDALISGFHEATATHLAMLRAFADAPLLNDGYAEAAERGYHYHEFGDIHLIQ